MRVLLCHRLNLGDLICASPGIQWAKRQWPESRFRLFTNDFAARVGALLPEVEHVYAYRKFGGPAVPEWRAILSARRWRARRLIGLSPDPDWRLGIRLMLLGAIKFGLVSKRVHVAERLAEAFGWNGKDELPPATLRPPQGKGTPRDVAIWISARKPSNRPTDEQVRTLVQALERARPGISITVLGLPAQADSAAHQAHHQMAVESPPFGELLAELAASRSVITPDGGISHIAGAFGRPVVTLFGNVPVDVWRPYTPKAVALQAPSRRVADIPVSQIVEAWESLRSSF